MQYAIDKYTGSIVEAINASHFKNRYICPKCYASCHLCAGSYYSPYFAHDSGVASKDCENYHPGETPSSDSNTANLLIVHRLPRLYVCVSDERSLGSAGWKLMLLVPECSQGQGNVEIIHGYYGTVNIPISRLMRGGQRVHVRPRVTYQIGIQGQVDPIYHNMVKSPIPGLSTTEINVFRYASSGGRKLQKDQELYWGRTYCLVWHEKCEFAWWPTQERLRRCNLTPNDYWHCAIIQIPFEENHQVRKWIENVLHKKVEREPFTLSLIAPVAIQRLEDESLLLPENEEVIFGISGEEGSISPHELNFLPPNGVKKTVKLSNSLSSFISMGKLPPGRTEVWLSDNQDSAISLYVANLEKRNNLRGVRFVFEEIQRERIVVVPVHSVQIRLMLEEVSKGLYNLIEVNIPRRVSATLCIGERSNSSWQQLTLVPDYVENEKMEDFRHKEFEERVLKEIQAFLSRCKGNLDIDFGNYGKVNLNLSHSIIPETYPFEIRFRRQLEWVLSLLQARNHREKFSSGEAMKEFHQIVEQIQLEQFNLEDRLLISRLLNYDYLPIAAESLLRGLVKHIKKSLLDISC